MQGPLLSGALFRHIVQELEAVTSREVVWKSVGGLSEEQRAECLDVLAIRWVHASTSVALVRAVARRVGRPDRSLHDEVISRATARVFSTIWRVIFNFVSGEAMVTRVPVIFKRTYSGIRVDATLEGAGRATVRVRDWADMDECTLHGIGVSIEVALRIGAKQDASVKVERTSDGARYAVTWRP